MLPNNLQLKVGGIVIDRVNVDLDLRRTAVGEKFLNYSRNQHQTVPI